MKKLILAALAVLVLCTGSAMAGSESYFATHTVVKGNTLWGISHKYLGTGKQHDVIAKANGITDPRKLRIGTVLFIPVVPTIHIHNHNTAPFGAKAVQGDLKVLWAIDNVSGVNYMPEMKDALKQVVSERNPSPYILMKGEKADCYSDKFSAQYGMYCPPNGFEYDWDKVGTLRADFWSAKTDNVACLVRVIEACGNVDTWCWKIEIPPPPPIEEVPVPPIPAPPEPILPPVEEKIPPVTIVPGVPKEEIPPAETRPCPECQPELEVDAGIAIWVHDPHGEGRTTGKNVYAQVMYWENFEADCSSEYWYGFGGLGSAYNYGASRFPSKGKGWRAAGQAGIKRNYSEMGKDGIELERSWQFKARLGWEESWWKNHKTEIHRWGPTYGPYVEYNHELIDESLKLVVQAEGWFGNSSSQTFVGTFVGLDWQFADRFTLRIGPGYDYQGWDHLSAFAPQAQIMYDLPNQNGRIAFGTYGKFYTHISPTLGLLGRYESGDLIKKIYGQSRRREYQSAGIGIGGGNNEPLSEKISAEPMEGSLPSDVTTIEVAADAGLDNLAEPVIMLSQAEREEYDRLDRKTWPAVE